jgi:serine/threonine-protein kinase HipA
LEPGARADDATAEADILDLEDLAAAAQRLDAGEPVDERSRALLAAGSSPGGARPKALVRDGDRHWLAKFPSRRDRYDEVGLEATGLALARAAGLEVPEFTLAQLSEGHRALLVKRFDLTPTGGQRHMLSVRTLLAARGSYVLGYADLIDVVRRHGAQPERDAPALFRQMAFNALFGNTDDHLKNFWLMRERAGWVLTPAFDLVPDVGERVEHVLLFGISPTAPGPDGLLALGRAWGISGAARAVDEVCDALTRFAEMATGHAVPEAQIAHFQRDIAARCRTVGAS